MYVPQDDRDDLGEINLGFGQRDSIRRSLHQNPLHQPYNHLDTPTDEIIINNSYSNNYNRY